MKDFDCFLKLWLTFDNPNSKLHEHLEQYQKSLKGFLKRDFVASPKCPDGHPNHVSSESPPSQQIQHVPGISPKPFESLRQSLAEALPSLAEASPSLNDIRM